MQKENSIQDLENINLDLFKSKPLDLIPVGKNLVSSNRHDKAIEVFEFGLKTIISQNNNNEFHIDCAKFNYHYADVLIAKLYESNEIFNQKKLPEEEKKEKIEESNKQIANNNFSDAPANEMIDDDKEDEEEEEGDEEEDEEDDDDEKIAFEHLAVAEKTLKNYLEKYDNTHSSELSPVIVNYYLDLSDIYFKFGELELIKSDFKTALDFFNQAVKLKKAYDTKYSRAIAEIYFMMASACDADVNHALVFYYKTYLILMYHLKEKMNQVCDINIEFDTLNQESIFLDKDFIKVDIKDNDKIKDLKETINDVVIKIEDVCEEIKLLNTVIQEKVAAKSQEITFNKNYDMKNVIDISKSGVLKKKQDPK